MSHCIQLSISLCNTEKTKKSNLKFRPPLSLSAPHSRFNKPNGETSARGKTRPEVLLRYLSSKSGQLYNEKDTQRDENSIYNTGLYEVTFYSYTYLQNFFFPSIFPRFVFLLRTMFFFFFFILCI